MARVNATLYRLVRSILSQTALDRMIEEQVSIEREGLDRADAMILMYAAGYQAGMADVSNILEELEDENDRS